jgi:hypothetical protein
MESSTEAATQAEPALKAKSRGSVRHQDALDQPARRLGTKRSALHHRKHRNAMPTWHAGVSGADSSTGAHVLVSSDGSIEFAIRRGSAGLMIEKRVWRPSGQRTAQTLFFRDTAGFDRWCDLEPVRFDDPLLHGELRRHGHECLRER